MGVEEEGVEDEEVDVDDTPDPPLERCVNKAIESFLTGPRIESSTISAALTTMSSIGDEEDEVLCSPVPLEQSEEALALVAPVTAVTAVTAVTSEHILEIEWVGDKRVSSASDGDDVDGDVDVDTEEDEEVVCIAAAGEAAVAAAATVAEEVEVRVSAGQDRG